MAHHFFHDWSGNLIELVVELEERHPVVCIEVIYILGEVLDERQGHWGALVESLKGREPSVQRLLLVWGTHFFVVGLDDLHKATHDEGEDGDASQHDDD